MVAWRRRGWQHQEELAVPAELDLPGLAATRAFLHRTLRDDRSLLRRTVPLNAEQVTVETTGRSTLECRALPRALAFVEPPDEVRTVHLAIGTGRGGVTVVIDWRSEGTSRAEVRGRSRTWVLGVKGVLQRFFDDRGFTAPSRAPGRWRRRRLTELSAQVSTEVVATVVGAVVLAIAARWWPW